MTKVLHSEAIYTYSRNIKALTRNTIERAHLLSSSSIVYNDGVSMAVVGVENEVILARSNPGVLGT